jgi:sugar lactone lactonase YvrE
MTTAEARTHQRRHQRGVSDDHWTTSQKYPAMNPATRMHFTRKLMLAVALVGLVVQAAAGTAGAGTAHRPSHGRLLASGLRDTIGGTIGPDGALYVAEGGTAGRITRIDPKNGKATTFFSGLPTGFDTPPFGGVLDVAFIGTTAYALVTLVSPDVGGTSVDGIYRIDDRHHATVIADIGAWSIAHPPRTPFDVPTGLQFALQPVSHGFLVSDGHHNRVLHVTLGGVITQQIQFDNVVPTGLAVTSSTVYVSEVGPVPYAPKDGKVVSFDRKAPRPRTATTLASGFSAIVDVELGPDGALYALSQGDSPGDVPPATPALPNTGRLLRVNKHGTFSVLVDRLNLPSSLDFVGDTAFVVTLNGEVWKINDVSDDGERD